MFLARYFYAARSVAIKVASRVDIDIGHSISAYVVWFIGAALLMPILFFAMLSLDREVFIQEIASSILESNIKK